MVRIRVGHRPPTLVVALVLLLGLIAGLSLRWPAFAQETEGGYPARVHAGSCAELGETAFELGDVGPGTVREGQVEEADDPIGSESARPVAAAITTVPVPLSGLTEEPHAVAVAGRGDDGQRLLACGDIGGAPVGNDLSIGLAEEDGSGLTGIALLNGRDDETTVSVYLAAGLAGDAATPVAEAEASPEGEEADIPTAAVSIENFSFGPITLEIAAGTEVTWTNNDDAAHTVTADDQSFSSGQIEPGASFSYLFAEAGTVTYFCENHPRMTGSVIVT